MTAMIEIDVHLREPHPAQLKFIRSTAKRRIIRAGRRLGKTVGIAIYAIEQFLDGRRILYAAPTQEQTDAFWWEIKQALVEPLEAGVYYKNETRHIIEVANTQNRLRAKTAWNADTLRGDYADVLILDEWQLMNEDAWNRVGAPMLLDNDGDAVFIYTPPSTRTRSVSKATDKLHAAKLFAKAEKDTTGRWETFSFRSHANPHISEAGLVDIVQDMTALAYRQEILAEDVDEIPGALWTRAILDDNRVESAPVLRRIVVAVDPAATANEESSETGIVVCGVAGKEGYTLEDTTIKGSPAQWARRAIAAYYNHEADLIVAESNQGGDMVKHTIHTEDSNVPIKLVRASRGKHTRAEPVSALYEQGRIHHVGVFPELEDQLCTWVPGDDSPDRLDALVWGFTELMLGTRWRVAV